MVWCRPSFVSSLGCSLYPTTAWCLCIRDLINELSSIKDVTVSPEAHSHIKTVEELTPPLASASGAPSTSINPSPHVWAENFIPQYGGRDDFPSIPMQIPVSPPLFDYGASAPESNFGNDPMAMEGQLFSQMPSGFEFVSLLSILICDADSPGL